MVGLILFSTTGADSLGRFVVSTLPPLGSPYGVAVAFLFAGVLVLAFTPVVRVGLAVSAFARERNGRYVAATLFVLLLLITTVLVGAYQ